MELHPLADPKPFAKTISSTLTPIEWEKILGEVWGEAVFSFNGGAYIDYCARTCLEVRKDWRILIQYKHVVFVMRLIRGKKTREDIKQIARADSGFPDVFRTGRLCEVLDVLVDLSGSLVSMYDLSFQVWGRGTLHDLLQLKFEAPLIMTNEGVKFGALIGRNLESFAQIQVEWTDDLMEHLRLTDDDSTVYIFYHTTFLKAMDSLTGDDAILPRGLARETLDTLGFLFPKHDRKTEKWLLGLEFSDRELDVELLNVKPKKHQRRPDHFKFWHDRLIILNEAFENADPPPTLKNLWRDRRQGGQQWFNSWMTIVGAFLAVVFGIIQGITGIMQVFKSYHPTVVKGD